ncbi:MAG: hypothetical protein K7J46_21035, partial [Bryobacter sp.]|nr:hypothetical protein [Bryobacter sp. CoA8 C33]
MKKIAHSFSLERSRAALRANIAETLPVSLIREQGGGANRNEQAVQEWSSLGVGGRGTEWRR